MLRCWRLLERAQQPAARALQVLPQPLGRLTELSCEGAAPAGSRVRGLASQLLLLRLGGNSDTSPPCPERDEPSRQRITLGLPPGGLRYGGDHVSRL